MDIAVPTAAFITNVLKLDGAGHRGKPKTQQGGRSASADQFRRYEDMNFIDQTSIEERSQDLRSSFDEHIRETSAREFGEQIGDGLRRENLHALGEMSNTLGQVRTRKPHRCLIQSLPQPTRRGEIALAREDQTGRDSWPRWADRQQRVVGTNGPRADDDRVHQAAQGVNLSPRFVAADPSRIALMGGQLSIQRHRPFGMDVGASFFKTGQVGCVEPAGFGLVQSHLDFDSG